MPAAGLAASLPVVVSVVDALADGWRPVGDRAIIATRAVDVLTSESPLLGQFSASSGVTGDQTHSLGPMLYWLLAIPVRISPSAVAVVAGAVAVASIMATVALAHRRGGVGLALFTALGLALICGGLPGEALHDVWNPYIAILPMGLLVFVAWSLACGEHRLLPLAVVLASFVVQCHLSYVLPATGALMIGIAGLWLSRHERRGPLRPWVIGAVVVGLVCWSFPLVDQVVHRPGNLVAVANAATALDATAGGAVGWHAAVRAVGVPPWWLSAPPTPFDWLGDVGQRPGIGSIFTALLLLAGLLVVLVAGLHRRRGDVVSAAGIGLLVCACVFATAAGTPTADDLFVSIGYTLWWSLPAGMAAWGLLAWAVAALARRDRAPAAAGAAPPRRGPSTALAAAGVAVVVATGVLVATRLGPDPYEPAYQAVGSALSSAVSRLPPGEIELDTRSLNLRRFDVETSLVYELRRRGVPFTTRGDLASQLGEQYQSRGDGRARTLRLVIDGEPPPRGGRVLSRAVLPPSKPGRGNVDRPKRIALVLQP